MIPSPERLQETQLGALGVPSRGLIYKYNATNVRKRDVSYDRVVHTDKATERVIMTHTMSYTSSSRVIMSHKFLAVPTARVARMLAPRPSPLAFATGLELVGGSAPKPLAWYRHLTSSLHYLHHILHHI